MSAEGKQIRGGEGRRSRNSSGAVEGRKVGATAVRHRMAWLTGSGTDGSASASTTSSGGRCG